MKKKWWLMLSIVLLQVGAFAQSEGWKTETVDQCEVKSKIDKRTNSAGKSETVLRYVATTSEKASLGKIKQLMKTPNQYRNFLENTEESKLFKKVSNTEWYMYLFFDAPWPMPNSDCVHHMTIEENTDKKFVISGKATPNEMEKKDVDRIEFYTVSYTFETLRDNSIQLIIDAAFAPTTSPPDWLIKSWFPNGPAGIAERIFEAAEKL